MSYYKIGEIHEFPFAGSIDAVCLSCGKRVYADSDPPTIILNVGFYRGFTDAALCANCVIDKNQGALGILIGDAIVAGLGLYPYLRTKSLALRLEDVLDRIRSAARYSIAVGLQSELEKKGEPLRLAQPGEARRGSQAGIEPGPHVKC